MAVGDAAGDPALEQMVAFGQFGGAGNRPVLATAGADEEHHAAAPGDFVHNLRASAQMGRGGVERDDVDALPYAVDVAGICRVPERSSVALVGLRGEEQFERDVGGRGWVGQEGVRLVVRAHVGAQFARLLGCEGSTAVACTRQAQLTLLLEAEVLFGHRLWCVGGGEKAAAERWRDALCEQPRA